MAVTLKQLLEAGCHFGHQSRRWNPKMEQYLYTERDGVHVFDLVKTKEGLDLACEYLRELVSGGSVVLFVGCKRQASGMVQEAAKRVGVPFVTERWLGGTFTNFSQMKKRIDRLADLKAKKEAGDLKEFTKKEQLLIDREIVKLERFFGGLSQMPELPKAVFVVDTHKEDTTIREAKRMGIKVVGIVDSNGDPEGIDYVIPANDDAVKSIELIINEVAGAVEEGRQSRTKIEEKAAKAEAKKKKVVLKIEGVVDEPEEI